MASADRAHPLALVQFPFSGGIDEANRAELVEPGQGWPVLENGRANQRGGYSTRSGFTYLGNARFDATSATSGLKLFTDERTTNRITETLRVESWSTSASAWKDLSRVPEVDYSTHAVPNVSSVSTPEDIEYCNGYIAVTSVVTSVGFPRIVILDATTLSTVQTPTAIGVIRPLLASFSSRYFVALYVDPTAIKVYILDTLSAASVTAGWSLLANVGIDYADEAVAIESLPDRVVVAYVNNTGGTDRVTIKSYNQTGLIDSTTVNTASAKPITLDIKAYPGASTLWVAWSQGLPLKMCGLTTTSLSTVVSTTATVMTATSNWGPVTISPSAAGVGRIIGQEGSGSVPRVHMIGFQNLAGVTTVVGAQVDVQGCGILGRAFYMGSRHYVLACGGLTTALASAGNVQKTGILVDFTDDASWLRPVANIFPGLVVASSYSKSKCIPGPVATTVYVSIAATQSGVGDAGMLVALDFASNRRWQAVAHGNSTYLSGGLASCFDGLRAAEVGFLYRPTLPTSTFTATGITGSFRYVAVYEEVDGDGNWHVSGVSDPSAVISPANQKVNITTQPYAITARSSLTLTSSSLRIAFYRTLTGGVAPYYRVGVTGNDPTSIANTFIDTVTDAVLATKAKLYAQPGVLGTAQDRRAPPGLSNIVSYNGMLVGSCGSDIWYSGQAVSGEGVWFNPIFQVPVPGQGDITALFVQDGTLFVAKQREIYAINGEAPADNGSGGGLGQPRRLSVDVGAISPFTCTTAYGVFFQSDRGIEILDRNQGAQWVGEGVQLTLLDYPVVTSMTMDPRSSTVLIEIAQSSSAGLVAGSGRTLVYDLSLRVWISTDRRTSVSGVVDAPSQSACMLFNGAAWRYAWLAPTGYVHIESSANLDADAYWIAKRARSGNVKSGGLQGYQHVNKALLLGKKHTAHDLEMSFAYDYGDFKPARLYTSAEIESLTERIPNVQLEHGLHDDARCEAIQMQLVDATPSGGEAVGTGEAGTWVALAFEAVLQQGAYLLPDEAK